MGNILTPPPSPVTRSRPRLRRTHRRRHSTSGLETTFVIQPGGMVELALRELGAVLTRVLPPDS
jgi:hypothetical protein